MYKFYPVGHKIMVRLEKKERETVKSDEKDYVVHKSGLVLPKKNEITQFEDRSGDAAEVGVLVAMGKFAFKSLDGCPDENWAEIGDTVVFPAYSGRRYEQDGYIYHIFEDQLVFAIAPKKEAQEVNVR